MQRRNQWWVWAGLWAVLLWSPLAMAQGDAEYLVTMSTVPGGGEDRLIAELSEIPEIDLRESDWFYAQVRQRAFTSAGIGDRESDVMWVMRGSDIDIVIYMTSEGMDEIRVRFLTPAEGLAEHEFYVDRGDEGPTRGAVRLIRAELERFIGSGQTTVIVERPPEDEEEVTVDPREERERAIAAETARAERLQRDWLWARAHFRMFRKDFGLAGAAPELSFQTGFMAGFELDVEAFPFVLGDPDMVEPGVYVTYNHGFDGLNIIDEGQDPPVQTSVSVNLVSIEGGLIYRLDSPLDEDQHRNRQLRFKLGARYDTYNIGENPVRPTTATASLVLGTRLVLPIPLIGEEFGITAAVDVVPVAGFVDGAAVFGGGSTNFGFGSELGMVYEVMDKLFMSAGYSFRVMRSVFSGEGEAGVENASVFAMTQGLRAGVVYQY